MSTVKFGVLHTLNFGLLPLVLLYFETFNDTKFDLFNHGFATTSIIFLSFSLNHRNINFSANWNYEEEKLFFLNIILSRILMFFLTFLIFSLKKTNSEFLFLALALSLCDGVNVVLLKRKNFRTAFIMEIIKYVFCFSAINRENFIEILISALFGVGVIGTYLILHKLKKINFSLKRIFFSKISFAIFLPLVDFLIFNFPRFFIYSVNYEETIRLLFYISLTSMPILVYLQKRLAFNQEIKIGKKLILFTIVATIVLLLTNSFFSTPFLIFVAGLLCFLVYSISNFSSYKIRKYKILLFSGIASLLIVIVSYNIFESFLAILIGLVSRTLIQFKYSKV